MIYLFLHLICGIFWQFTHLHFCFYCSSNNTISFVFIKSVAVGSFASRHPTSSSAKPVGSKAPAKTSHKGTDAWFFQVHTQKKQTMLTVYENIVAEHFKCMCSLLSVIVYHRNNVEYYIIFYINVYGAFKWNPTMFHLTAPHRYM